MIWGGLTQLLWLTEEEIMTDDTKPDPKRAAQLAMGQPAPKADPKPAPKAAEPKKDETDGEEA